VTERLVFERDFDPEEAAPLEVLRFLT